MNLRKRISVLLFTMFVVNLLNNQVVRDFTQRTSEKVKPSFSKDTKSYFIKGDFELIGNTLVDFVPNKEHSQKNSGNYLQFVNVDSTNGIFNSSSAKLNFL